MKPNLLSDEKVIITAAITGGLHGKESNPNIPTTPEEQTQAALDCYNAGASILHLCGGDGDEPFLYSLRRLVNASENVLTCIPKSYAPADTRFKIRCASRHMISYSTLVLVPDVYHPVEFLIMRLNLVV